MENMNLFEDNPTDIRTKSLGTVRLIEKIESSSSDGQLEKWVIAKANKIYYLKGCSKSVFGEDMYECESECIASELAELFGLEHVVRYTMDEFFYQDIVYKVCLSEDFINGYTFNTYAEIIPDIGKSFGEDKYNDVISYNTKLKSEIDKILIFDAIIGNDDRHLNNLAIMDTGSDEFVLLFDNGAAMYSRIPDNALKLAGRTSFEYQKCRPFFDTIGKQLNLVKECNLKGVENSKLTEVVYKHVSKKRAKAIIALLQRNLKEVGDLYGRQLLY